MDGVPINDNGMPVQSRYLAEPLGSSAGRTNRIRREGPPARYHGKPGNAQREYRCGRRERSHAAACDNHCQRPTRPSRARNWPNRRCRSRRLADLAAETSRPFARRKLYFSETSQDPHDPNSPTTFYLTVDGQDPKAFDPQSRCAQHHRAPGRRGRLDHRKPNAGIARVSYSSGSFHDAGMVWTCR